MANKNKGGSIQKTGYQPSSTDTKISLGMIPKEDREKYFGNLQITYKGEIMDMIDMENQERLEINMNMKEK